MRFNPIIVLMAIGLAGCKDKPADVAKDAPKLDEIKILEPIVTLNTPFTGAGWSGNCILSLSISDDAKRLAVAADYKDVKIQVWDLEHKKTLAEFPGSYTAVLAPDGKQIFRLRKDGKAIIVSDASTGADVRQLDEVNYWLPPVFCDAVSPNGSTLVLSTSYGFDIWDVPTGKQSLHLNGKAFSAFCFFEDSKRLATGSDGEIAIWDIGAEKPSKTFMVAEKKEKINALAVNADGSLLASDSGMPNSVTRIWDLKTGEKIHELGANEREVGSNSIAFVAGGKTLAFTDKGNRLVLLDIPTKTRTYASAGTPGLGHRIMAMAATRDRSRLAVGREGGTIMVFDLKNLH